MTFQQCREQQKMDCPVLEEPQKAQSRLSKQKQRTSQSNQPIVCGSPYSVTGTSRSSQAYLAGSRACLLLEQAELEGSVPETYTLESSKSSQGSLAARRNRRELQLQKPIIASSRASQTGTSPHVLTSNLSRTSTVAAEVSSNTSSPFNARRNSIDSQEMRKSISQSSFARLDSLGISPVKARFFDDHQSAPSTAQFYQCMSRELSSSSSDIRLSAHELPASPITGGSYDISYAPMRRRSLIQIPGVATRSPCFVTADKNREAGRLVASNSTGLGLAAANAPMELGDGLPKQLSLPNLTTADQADRPITPCEMEYQQLGGMKFGTLRITNASPTLSFASGHEEKEVARKLETMSLSQSKENGQGDLLGAPEFIAELSSSPPKIRENNRWKPSHKRAASQPTSSSTDSILSPNEKLLIRSTHQRLSCLAELSEEPLDHSAYGPLTSHPVSRPVNIRTSRTLADAGDELVTGSEKLDIRNDPSAKPVRDIDSLRSQTDRRGLTRSSSGFASQGSSFSSRATTLTAGDSISGSSSRSSYPTRSELKPEPPKLSRASMPIPPRDDEVLAVNPDMLTRRSRTLSHERMDSSAAAAATTPESDFSRGKLPPRRTKAGILGRLFGNSRASEKADIAKGFAHHDISSIPRVPDDLETRFRVHSAIYPTTAMKLTRNGDPGVGSLANKHKTESYPYGREFSSRDPLSKQQPFSRTRVVSILDDESNYSKDDDFSKDELLPSYYQNDALIKNNSSYTSDKFIVVDSAKELPPVPAREPLLRSSFAKRPRHVDLLGNGGGGGGGGGYGYGDWPLPEEEALWNWAIKRKHSTLHHRPAFSEDLALSGSEFGNGGGGGGGPRRSLPKPRYRVLHSYNSPAYRNIPIWG
ncbi:hypothetical protein AAL_02689 [Moelleriella libera RCEF 2490]|uniref:Uncharacterized protein n=1 Tax=Moelleriella libera RCEF 2490 TaxID=1081109 RepID=A0A168ETS4_9HYPO|nr:hypothetical protein AAL_02689 [Moelleriella libera RCEF 2490]